MLRMYDPYNASKVRTVIPILQIRKQRHRGVRTCPNSRLGSSSLKSGSKVGWLTPAPALLAPYLPSLASSVSLLCSDKHIPG